MVSSHSWKRWRPGSVVRATLICIASLCAINMGCSDRAKSTQAVRPVANSSYNFGNIPWGSQASAVGEALQHLGYTSEGLTSYNYYATVSDAVAVVICPHYNDNNMLVALTINIDTEAHRIGMRLFQNDQPGMQAVRAYGKKLEQELVRKYGPPIEPKSKSREEYEWPRAANGSCLSIVYGSSVAIAYRNHCVISGDLERHL